MGQIGGVFWVRRRVVNSFKFGFGWMDGVQCGEGTAWLPLSAGP